MGTRLVRFDTGGVRRWGVVTSRGVAPLSRQERTLREFILAGGLDEARLISKTAGEVLAFESARLVAPVTSPCAVVCQGLNYYDHKREVGGSGKRRSSFNLLFQKASSSLSAAHGAVIRPQGVKLLDYELELGLVLKRPIDSAREVREAELPDYIAGIVIANDISAREIQIRESQWFKGKSFRTFCPVGPWIYLLEPEEFSALKELRLELKVNGRLRQSALTRDMIFHPHETLSEISRVFDLEAGDLILTGTPGGVALKLPREWLQNLIRFAFSPRRVHRLFMAKQLKRSEYLKPGDTITARIFQEGEDGKEVGGGIDLGTQELHIEESLGASHDGR